MAPPRTVMATSGPFSAGRNPAGPAGATASLPGQAAMAGPTRVDGFGRPGLGAGQASLLARDRGHFPSRISCSNKKTIRLPYPSAAKRSGCPSRRHRGLDYSTCLAVESRRSIVSSKGRPRVRRKLPTGQDVEVQGANRVWLRCARYQFSSRLVISVRTSRLPRRPAAAACGAWPPEFGSRPTSCPGSYCVGLPSPELPSGDALRDRAGLTGCSAAGPTGRLGVVIEDTDDMSAVADWPPVKKRRIVSDPPFSD
ncbi:hypothetical protein SAMN07250955_1196 [Arboricoccus pini]|uniref:Uncharacterized protein n=1 Tax=Arboricoccus pini TaxID=1963835 RepID=A0A212S0R1_9PROT|nr:hypothetical protein SAMN07250955_1196 [Arboricoccus pini]